jgi:predicted lipid-binding transport protein (Tim44 family)
MGKQIEPYNPQASTSEIVERAIREAESLSTRPIDGGSTSLHVHHHYAPAAAPAAPVAERPEGPLSKYGEWLIVLTGILILVGGVVAGLMLVFATIVAALEAMAGSLAIIGIVVAVIISAAKAPSAPAGKGRK